MAKEKSMVLVKPEKMELQEFEIPEIGPEEFLLKVEMVGICGGDPIEYRGLNPKTEYPLILGHEVAGVIDKIGENAKDKYGVEKGDKVSVEPYIICGECYYCLNSLYQFCENSKIYGVNISSKKPPHIWGAYGEYMYGAPGSKVHKIKDDVSPKAACMSSVIGNGVRWVKRLGEVQFNDSVVIIGPGAQGLATTIAAKEAGANPIIIMGKTRNPEKWDLASEYGADYIIDTDKVDNPIEKLENINNGNKADVVIETTGAGPMMELGLDLVRPAGKLIVIGTNGFDKSKLTTDKIVFNEIEVKGGLGQSWDTETAVDIINSQKYAIEKMVTHVYPLEKAKEAIEFYMNNNGEAIRVAIKP